jgi:hypothetical protein
VIEFMQILELAYCTYHMHEKNTRTEKGLLADLAIAHQNSRPAMMILISRDVIILIYEKSNIKHLFLDQFCKL